MIKISRLLVISGLLLPLMVSAVGVSVSPPRLEIISVAGRETNREIVVSNPSRDVAIFDIYPDDFVSEIRISPESFVLESGDQKKVAVAVTPKNVGRFETNISIVARALSDSAFNAASGVKIPLNVEVGRDSSRLALASSALPISARTVMVFGYVILVVMYVWFLKFAFGYLKKP
jgi:hypothetical protein